ncbi:hypothetical protein CABS01_12662 [Colletotrichum abscissum]|uniref:Nitrogen regulatory protein areA GATA-like domain-containing protein n=5 Tax=Colletotrichum acutatum species complex TaxID=2707335 RepID=A0A9Q0B049_9PEZI|nr:uncharacterized protein CCOS01_09208 [Colletotrichum costaricense]XP_060384381.1 uncharacterized protein CTAM01_04982 [Colletotrichum tamarilloi]XP_060396246.1 uncharacterized protein CABS01_12662 [Colletotrichum abscissum]KAI3536502.1 hypothetical protein CSPX01_10763 [Colletotrichum filicis]KAK1472571.1 hypothetical protein CCUS01_17317 [Colletotrichum cuscutae]KXH34591.1 hypothetical protein CSIM01_11815 [Colletotrichum simmondsii]KAI3543845.1 hypothetical protein CABS02_09915 [Colletot
MPYPLDTHVLTVDTNVINKVDTSNPQNLYSMWTVFAKCAESVEQGRRLENLSWRLWNRETFCCTEEEQASITATSLPREIPQASRIQDIPQLSGSVESENDDEAVDFTSLSAPLEIRPRIQRQDSCASNRSRGKERHITSGDFEKMVVSIIKENEPLSAPLPQMASPYMPPMKETPDLAPASPVYEHSGSTTTESPCKSSEEEHSQEPTSPEITSRTTVVRGFSPSQIPRAIPASPKVISPAAIPEPRSSPAAKPILSKKQPMFSIGESCSSSEQGHSIENLRPIPAPVQKRKMFQVGGSSEEDSSLKSALASQPGSLLTGQKKTTSFADHVSTRMINDDNSAIADDSETDYVDESAIDDDDDSSDWEDSIEDSNKSSIDEKTFFQRVDSKVNLTSRRSLITLMMTEQNDRSSKLGNIASQSTSALPWSRTSHPAPPTLAVSPNDSDDAPLMMKRGNRSSPLKPINEVPRSAAQPIHATASHSHLQAALSPRTTRRNMLATELTESLRRNLLWERQQKSSTANAVLKRRHTSHDVANLKQYPEKVCLKNGDAPVNPQYFSKDTDNFGGYHSKGW